MNAAVSNEQLYELAVAVLRQVEKLLISVDEVCVIGKAINADFAAMRHLPLVEAPPCSEESP